MRFPKDRHFSTRGFGAGPSVLLLGWIAACAGGLAGPPGVAGPSRPIGALGRLEPEGGVVHVAAPYSIQGPSILAELLVREGQSVTNAQPLARTHTHDAAFAAWQHAVRLVGTARARLAQAGAGAKPADVAALEAESRREAAETEDARREFDRQRRLREDGASSRQALDSAETRLLSRSNALEAAQRRLASGREVRAEDVDVARAELAVAEAQAERARTEWQQTIVRAPGAGRILSIHARLGEEIKSGGLLDLGHTEVMMVRAEVYETDVRHARAGQKAEITGEAFEGTLEGVVESVGLQVLSNRLLKPDPSEFADSRVVEVVVRLRAGAPVSNLTGALVNVRILP